MVDVAKRLAAQPLCDWHGVEVVWPSWYLADIQHTSCDCRERETERERESSPGDTLLSRRLHGSEAGSL